MKFNRKILLLIPIAMQSWSCTHKPLDPAVIVPQPVSVTAGEGRFVLDAKTVIASNLAQHETLALWPDDLPGKFSAKAKEASVFLTLDESGVGEAGAYSLRITPDLVNIEASTREGLFYGIRSLQQLYDAYGRRIPCAVIEDAPRFASRALLLDVSHHYMPVGFIRRLLDMMSYLKMNRFVWYLGGDGGWRLESRACPQLTGNTAWRTEASYARWKESDGGFCPHDTAGAYGGYYTEADVRQIVEYARSRFIDIVPAFDLPCSHSKIAGAIGLECHTGTEHRSAETGMMKDILSEVAELFEPEFIYLGNGQADQARGSFCLECQPRVESGKTGDILDSRHSYALYSAEKYLLEYHGVRLMAWDESLRGVLSRDAAVIAWNKTQEGITAARMGYDVILSPSAYSSLDYYQDNPAADPSPSPGFLPIEKLYNYDPLCGDFPEDAERRILGIQANLWTTYVGSDSDAEFKLYPRLLAVAEVGWTYPQRKSIYDFRNRTERMSHVLLKKGYYCFDIAHEEGNRPEFDQPVRHLAWGCPVAYRIPASRQFPGFGGSSLTDGQRGGWSFDDGRWQGFRGTDMDVVIDLETPVEIHSISVDFMDDPAVNISRPMWIEVYVSDDGKDFSLLGRVENKTGDETESFSIVTYEWEGCVTTRYIRYLAAGGGRIGSWMFADEIIVG